MLSAASLVLTQEGEGSNPSGPTFCKRAHDVVVAFLLAMQSVSVRFRLGALKFTTKRRKGKSIGDGSCFENSRANSLFDSLSFHLNF